MTDSTTRSIDTAPWRAGWQDWHGERTALATGPHGLAALTGTHWLGDTPVRIDEIPGTWTESDGHAVGDGPDFQLDLAPGDRHRLGDLLLQPLVRAGQVALRVFDPAAATRTTLLGIDTFEFDPAWVIRGAIESDSGRLQLEHIDGFVSDNRKRDAELPLSDRPRARRTGPRHSQFQSRLPAPVHLHRPLPVSPPAAGQPPGSPGPGRGVPPAAHRVAACSRPTIPGVRSDVRSRA